MPNQLLPGMELLERLAARRAEFGDHPDVELLISNIARAQELAHDIEREAAEFSAGPLNDASEGTEQWLGRLTRLLDLRRQLYACTSTAIEAARRLEVSRT